MTEWVRWFRDVGNDDVGLVGGKNASLGEMLRHLTGLGVRVPDGFAVTAAAYRAFMAEAGLEAEVAALLARPRAGVDDLVARAAEIRRVITGAPLPASLEDAVRAAYAELSRQAGGEPAYVAVRSSATAEDLPNASFAGQQESFLYVQGDDELLDHVRRCFASLYTPRAISYREDMGFRHADVALSVGVQRMVRSDRGSAGVIFTLDPETGFRDVVLVTGAWGLGENVVQGRVGPDQFVVHKPMLKAGKRAIVARRLGPKEQELVFDRASHRLQNLPVPRARRAAPCLGDDQVLELARWALLIEDHYTARAGVSRPMDVEWALDGVTGELFVVQARPETVHGQAGGQAGGPVLRLHRLEGGGDPGTRAPVLAQGLAIGDGVAAGPARPILDPRGMGAFRPGDVLVTEITDPDWEPILKQASAVVTERGGRTSHAAIVARELGIPAIVGAVGATQKLPHGAAVTVACCEGEVGRVYQGALPFAVEEVDPGALERPRTKIMLNVADPEQAFRLGRMPVDGVGLVRMEFVFASRVRVHPLALTRFAALPPPVQAEVEAVTGPRPDKPGFLVDTLAEGIATLAAAFWPRPVTLRFSDFKTNEYAHLIGGAQFEPREENPMIGWRGASRYYHPDYREGFLLECRAVRRVREDMGLENLRVMIPFCRTPAEGQAVLDVMREAGLERGRLGLEVWVMAEIPSNVLQAAEFARLFDGFSIGSNDLTQLVLGVDRDSERVAALFSERDGAVRRACELLLEAARAAGRPVGICGQGPSDDPEFAAFLVERGIDSLSLTPDAWLRTTRRILEVERALAGG